MIYHIARRKAWQTALRIGDYRAESLDTEGFIHCSTLPQVLPVAEKYYKGQGGLTLLAIDPTRLSATLKWEPPSGGSPPPGVPHGELFPHIYGPINLDAVIHVIDLEKDSHGKFRLPISTLK